jgi:hypothetical protein
MIPSILPQPVPSDTREDTEVTSVTSNTANESTPQKSGKTSKAVLWFNNFASWGFLILIVFKDPALIVQVLSPILLFISSFYGIYKGTAHLDFKTLSKKEG